MAPRIFQTSASEPGVHRVLRGSRLAFGRPHTLVEVEEVRSRGYVLQLPTTPRALRLHPMPAPRSTRKMGRRLGLEPNTD